MPAIVRPVTNNYEWKRLRKGIRALIEDFAPLATVHEEWKLEFDPLTSLGKVTALMNGRGAHAGFVHCWMIGLQAENAQTTEAGADRYIGGNTSEYILTFAVWGFFDYKGWRATFADGTQLVEPNSDPNAATEAPNATAYAENESRAMKAYIRANPGLTLDDGRARALPFSAPVIDIAGFSGGKQIIVAQGAMNVYVREAFV